jgi:hypothetical protein
VYRLGSSVAEPEPVERKLFAKFGAEIFRQAQGMQNHIKFYTKNLIFINKSFDVVQN